MEERITHIISEMLVDLANGTPDLTLLVTARKETSAIIWDHSGARVVNPSSDAAILRILAVISRHVLDQTVQGAKNIVYCYQTSALGFHEENGSLQPLRFGTMAVLDPIPGLYLGEEQDGDVQIALRMFGHLIESGTIARERVGKCPVCGRYFLSSRLGKRKSRACSREHQAVLGAREHRAGERYQERGRARNAERMRAIREAERLLKWWAGEGRTPGERERLLRVWNRENGSALGKRAFYNILEKGGQDNG